MSKLKKKETKPTPQQLKIITIISESMCVDESEITPGTLFSEDLNCDSIDFVEMTMMLEEDFGVEIDDEVASKLLTVYDVFKYIEKNVVNA